MALCLQDRLFGVPTIGVMRISNFTIKNVCAAQFIDYTMHEYALAVINPECDAIFLLPLLASKASHNVHDNSLSDFRLLHGFE